MSEPPKENEINLPRRHDSVVVQLQPTKGKLPDTPFAIFLFPPGSTTNGTKIPPDGKGELEKEYDLGATAASLVDSKLLFQGAVLFKEKDTVELTSEFFVAGNKLADTAKVEVSGNGGDAKPFQIRCKLI